MNSYVGISQGFPLRWLYLAKRSHDEQCGRMRLDVQQEVQARQLIHNNSRKTFLVLDHSKFSRAAHVRGGQIVEATKVFCDQQPPTKIMNILDKSGCEVVLCRRRGIV